VSPLWAIGEFYRAVKNGQRWNDQKKLKEVREKGKYGGESDRE